MSEQETETTQEAAPAEAETAQQQEAAPEPQYDGTDFIDFDKPLDDQRGQIQARLNRYHGHGKQNERQIRQLQEESKAQTEALNEMGKVARAMHDRLQAIEHGNSQQQVNDVLTRQKEALENGNMEEAARLTNELVELRVKEREPKAEPVSVEVPEPTPQPPFEMDDRKEEIASKWAGETNQDGSLKRPWADPDHQDHHKMQRAIQALQDNGEIDDINSADGFRAALRFVDERMAPKQSSRPAVAAVLSGNHQTTTQAKTAVTLSPAQKAVAANMGMTEEAYAKAVERLQGN